MAKLADIKIGSIWIARVNGNFRRVKVLGTEREDFGRTKFLLQNLHTGRNLKSRSAAFLRREVKCAGSSCEFVPKCVGCNYLTS